MHHKSKQLFQIATYYFYDIFQSSYRSWVSFLGQHFLGNLSNQRQLGSSLNDGIIHLVEHAETFFII